MNEPNVFYNLEAEQALIGIALNDADKVRMITDSPSDLFYDQKHRTIQEGMRALNRANATVDLVTMDEWLTRHQLTGQVSAVYLVECTQKGYLFSNAANYLSILQKCRLSRAIAMLGKAMIERAGGMDEPEDVREWAARQLKEMVSSVSVPLISMKDALTTTYSRLGEEQQQPDGPSRKILSGIAALDNRMGGLRGGEYVAIGARPSVGKSILALSFCVNAAKQGKRVLLVSLEMNEVQITERVLADKSGVPMQMITSGNIDQWGWENLASAMPPIASMQLWYSLEANTVEKIRRAAYQLYENGGLDLIAIDYLQLMDATYARKQSRQEQISEISRGLRKLATELNIPVLVLTQLNRSSVNARQVNGQKVKREPTMSEARESGAIEQDANIFILLHNPERDELQTDSDRKTFDRLQQQGMTMMRMIIDKNRQGKRGRIWVAFDGAHMRFLPIVKEEE